MSDIFEQIGITKEELIDRIVDKALGITADYRQTGEESWEEIPFSKVVDKKITEELSKIIEKLSPLIQNQIDLLMSKEIEKIFSEPFQRVDSFGRAKGELISIRDLIVEHTRNYWEATVDSNGKLSNSYNSCFPRSEYYAKKVMSEYYEKELVQEVKRMADDLASRIPETIGNEITKTVLKYLKKK